MTILAFLFHMNYKYMLAFMMHNVPGPATSTGTTTKGKTGPQASQTIVCLQCMSLLLKLILAAGRFSYNIRVSKTQFSPLSAFDLSQVS